METPLVSQQVKSVASLDDHSTLPTGNSWSCQQNNANNANYVTIPSGNVNNNNKSNTNAVVPVAESDKLLLRLLDAKDDCWENKKRRREAASFRFHQSEVFEIYESIWTWSYKPTTSVCFILNYPRYREVFAAKYRDRIVHHLLAPFILQVTEKVHTANGNISHGNRKNHSAHTAALQIQENLRAYPNGYAATMDVSGFFMNICRHMAYDVFVRFCNQFRPEGYTNEEVDRYLWILYRLITHDPTSDCIRNSPLRDWDFIPQNKTLFGKDGKGLPIGNFYSQLIANLVLSIWGKAILDMHLDCKITQFVDDMCVVAATVEIIHRVRKRSGEVLSELGLKLHPTKFYIQPTKHGVPFCGKWIFADRIYIGNRTVRACKNSIRQAILAGANPDNAKQLLCSYNSYVGFMCHYNTYKIQVMLAEMIMGSEYCKYLYFDEKQGQVVCKMFDEYKDLQQSLNDIRELNKHFNIKLKYMVLQTEHPMVVPAGTPRKQCTQSGVVVRYGYEPMAGGQFFKVMEQTFSEMPPKEELRKIVEESNAKRGIDYDPFIPSDYGYED